MGWRARDHLRQTALFCLSGSFTHMGIAVYRDSDGTVWLIQDFSD